MRIVKYFMMAMGAAGVVLSFVYELPAFGTHGLIVLACCALPALLGTLSTFVVPAMPRWASVVSAVAFLVAAMKTSEGAQLQNIMMVAAAGLVAAIALAVKPDRSASRASVAG